MTKSIRFPTLSQLARAEYDPTLSTPWSRVYWVASKRLIGCRYKVILSERTNTASCQCTAASFGNDCEHVLLAQTLDSARIWERIFADYSTEELRATIPGKESMLRVDIDPLSNHAALLVIDALLMAAGEGWMEPSAAYQIHRQDIEDRGAE